MNEEQLFSKLIQIIDTLLGPNGCPWDQKQTLQTLRPCVLEETCELIDSIEDNDNQGIRGELGDLLLNVVFIAKVCAKEGRFTLRDAIEAICHKLIYRHPHVFGDGKKIDTVDELINRWDELKKTEKNGSERKSAFDGVPRSLPSLARAQKMVQKMQKTGYQESNSPVENSLESEEAFGLWLFDCIKSAEQHGLNAELSLRHACSLKEETFREWEKQKNTP